MTEAQREIRRKKRVIEHAEKIGHVGRACRHFGIARSTFYLCDRYRESGDEGLKSRRFGCHHNHPNKTPDEVVEKILHLRRTYHMGPIRIVWYLERYHDIKTVQRGSRVGYLRCYVHRCTPGASGPKKCDGAEHGRRGQRSRGARAQPPS